MSDPAAGLRASSRCRWIGIYFPGPAHRFPKTVRYKIHTHLFLRAFIPPIF